MPRRPSIVLLSATGHAIALGVLALLSILAPDALPFPRELLAAPMLRVVQVPAPPPPPHRDDKPTPPPSADAGAFFDVAPVVPPDDVSPEPDGQPDRALGRRVDGIERDMGGVVGPGLGANEDAPPAPPVGRAPIRLHSGIETPRKVSDRAPAYPALAKAAGVQGIVILEVTISERGDVAEARVLRSIAVLDQAALDAVRSWKFSPARLNGEPIPVVMTVTVNFHLY